MAKPETKRHLVWLRSDLRTADNTALHAACADADAQVACLYAITPGQWRMHDVAGVRVDFELRTLKLLATELAALKIPLLIVQADSFAELPATIHQLCQQYNVSAVHANHQYEINESRRDQAVAAALARTGVLLHLHHDQCIAPPGTVLKPDGGAYSVFTPFKKNWLQKVFNTRPLPAPDARSQAFAVSDVVPDSVTGFHSHVNAEIAASWWPAGEDAALSRLQDFVKNDLRHYKDRRDFPAQDGVSRLSAYLAIGAVSGRQCLYAALMDAASNGHSAGHEQWISELGWRDFYKHVLVAWPRVCRHRAFQLDTEPVAWRHDLPEFQRWCEGKTGYPLVDAAMRQLAKTGWMHNRLRMVTAMFLTKDLLIDWRWGEKFFMQHLIDGDLSANNGGWQWSASTGNDAAPYFRIFNPYAQSRKFDADGVFIREYVPELRDYSSRDIHEPHASGQSSLFSDYPSPMVDHAVARERVLNAFRQVKPVVERA